MGRTWTLGLSWADRPCGGRDDQRCGGGHPGRLDGGIRGRRTHRDQRGGRDQRGVNPGIAKSHSRCGDRDGLRSPRGKCHLGLRTARVDTRRARPRHPSGCRCRQRSPCWSRSSGTWCRGAREEWGSASRRRRRLPTVTVAAGRSPVTGRGCPSTWRSTVERETSRPQCPRGGVSVSRTNVATALLVPGATVTDGRPRRFR